jgi:hypothetical protein
MSRSEPRIGGPFDRRPVERVDRSFILSRHSQGIQSFDKRGWQRDDQQPIDQERRLSQKKAIWNFFDVRARKPLAHDIRTALLAGPHHPFEG